jgi:hypothetical protein
MFFGIVRQSCGSDDHPTPNQFLFVYRLLSVSSLVKPGQRANVQSDPVQILLTVQSVVPTPRIPFVPAIESLLDNILVQQSHEQTKGTNANVATEHDYTQCVPEDCITFYLGGYVAYKLTKFTTCSDCVATLSDKENMSASSKLVELKTKGGLKLPSAALTALIKLLEQCFQKYSAKPNTNMYFDILNEILTSDELTCSGIGCEKHLIALTSRCIHFYVSTRLHFLKKSVNRSVVKRSRN